MKIISLKALTRLLFATCFALTSSFVFAEAKVPYQATAEQQVIHLNHSTVEQLITLKGIGTKKAQAIVTYREQVGDFTSIDELIKVKGIGEKVIVDNKSRIVI